MATIDYNSLATSLSPEVLALLAASYGRPADQVVETIVTRSENAKPKASKPSRLAAVKAAKAEEAEAAPIADKKPAMTVIELPPVGSHDARSFLIAMRRAVTRDEKIIAIAGYAGFDRHGDFGSQELAARMKAQRELRGCVASTTPAHSVRPTLTGYVSGLPDPTATKIADLQGREVLAAEAIKEHEEASKGHLERGDLANAQIEAQFAALETLRLQAIRADLAKLGA